MKKIQILKYFKFLKYLNKFESTAHLEERCSSEKKQTLVEIEKCTSLLSKKKFDFFAFLNPVVEWNVTPLISVGAVIFIS